MVKDLRQLIETRPLKYVSLKDVFINALSTRKMQIDNISIEELETRGIKKSDSLFILGSGSAINQVRKEEWDYIQDHDSLGFNDFLIYPFAPTYYHSEYNRDRQVLKLRSKMFQERMSDYQKTVMLISSRALFYGMHPRLTPQFFPNHPRCCIYRSPRRVSCPLSRPFRRNDFDGKYMYRGCLNLMLYLALIMGYKKVILLGCEMSSKKYFYDDRPQYGWLTKIKREASETEAKIGCSDPNFPYYDGLLDSKEKHNFATVVYAFNEFVFTPRKMALYVARKESVLYPRVPYFEIPVIRPNVRELAGRELNESS